MEFQGGSYKDVCYSCCGHLTTGHLQLVRGHHIQSDGDQATFKRIETTSMNSFIY